MKKWKMAALTALSLVTLCAADCQKGTGGADAASDGAVADDSAVANDSAVADDSASRGDGEAGAREDGSADAGPGDGFAPDSGVCSLPQVVGPCEAAIPRYWFNAASGRCEFFIYGGCGGNANNFASLEACIASCAPTSTNPCLIALCQSGRQCVFQGAKPLCAAPCDDAGACPPPTSCGCGASCPSCKDCRRVCLP